MEVLDQLDDPPIARVEVDDSKLNRIEPEQLGDPGSLIVLSATTRSPSRSR